MRAIPSAVLLSSGFLAAVILGGVRSPPPGTEAPKRMGAGPVVARYPTCLYTKGYPAETDLSEEAFAP